MEFLSTNNILDFEKGFISIKKKLIYGEASLTNEYFQISLRVFYWFDQEHGFQDIREVCERTIRLINNDPLKLGLLHFLKAYVNEGVLDCSAFIGGISNNIPQTVRALSNTYKTLMKESFSDMDLTIFEELEEKFYSLENARSQVLNYISEKGFNHLDELSILTFFHPSDVEEILYNLLLINDERTNSEKNKIANFIVNIVKNNQIDIIKNQNWMTEAVNDFINAFYIEKN